MQFTEAFWNETMGDFSGWETLATKLKEGKQNLKVYADSLRQRATLEESYAKGLLKISRGLSLEPDVGTLDVALKCYQKEIEVSAKSHLKASRDLTEEASQVNEICLSLRETRKAIEDNVRQLHQRLRLDWRRAVEAKKTYESKCKEEISSSQFYHKEVAKNGKTSREAERAKIKYDRMRQTLSSAENSYKTLIQEAEKTRSVWEKETTHSLEEFEKLEEERIIIARDSMWKSANVNSILCVAVDSQQEEIRLSLEKCFVQDCLNQLAQENATNESKPGPLWYQAAPTSSHYGLGPASSISTSSNPPYTDSLPRKSVPQVNSTNISHPGSFISHANVNTTPPKPPRLIHYSSSSWKSRGRFQSGLFETKQRLPMVDSVDNIEYFNLSNSADQISNSLSDNSNGDNSAGSTSSSSEYPWSYDASVMEKKIW